MAVGVPLNGDCLSQAELIVIAVVGTLDLLPHGSNRTAFLQDFRIDAFSHCLCFVCSVSAEFVVVPSLFHPRSFAVLSSGCPTSLYIKGNPMYKQNRPAGLSKAYNVKESTYEGPHAVGHVQMQHRGTRTPTLRSSAMKTRQKAEHVLTN